ncbi:MAG: hypothetical protein IKH78_04920 [Ruminococcus sp.]|nr:hypothetical protein [Ruminococcus sp.]
MKKMSIGVPIFVGFLLILLLPATLIFAAKNAMTPPDGGVLTDCVVTDYVKMGSHVSANVDYVNSQGKTINASITNGVGSKSTYVGAHYQCYVYENNPFEVYRKPDKIGLIALYGGAAASALVGLVLVGVLLKKRSKQGFLIKNGQQAQATITNVVVKEDNSGFTKYICDYSFTDSRGQMQTGKHTFMNQRVGIGNTFPVLYAEKGGQMVSDIVE